MNLLIISSTLIVCLILFLSLQNSKKAEEHENDAFFKREREANFVKKKSLDNLNYITIPEKLLNMEPLCMTSDINSCLSDLRDLSSYKIVNLTGYTNTDLKLKYGTANITILSEFDIHYTNLVTLLQKLAQKLHETGDDANAMAVLEFAVSTGSDVSGSYYLLAKLYQNAGTPEKTDELIKCALNINSVLKDTIVQNLKESYR